MRMYSLYVSKMIFLLAFSLLLFPGCSSNETESQKKTPAKEVKFQDPPEPTWAEAVEAVRNGDSIEIRLPTRQVSDAELAELSGLEALRHLNLPNSKITNQGLEQIVKAVPNLELLRFGSPAVTDAGMAVIVQFKNLRFLHLIHVPITDAGLQHLQAMNLLESFYLDGGNVTDVGLSELIKSLPELHFHRDQHHLPGDPHKDGH